MHVKCEGMQVMFSPPLPCMLLPPLPPPRTPSVVPDAGAAIPSVVPDAGAAIPLPPPTPPPPDIAGESVVELQFASQYSKTMSFPPLLCLQTLLKLSTTNWMLAGGSLVPSCVWTTKPWRALRQVNVADQTTACWTCWAGGPPTRQEQGSSLALGRRWWKQ